MVQKNTEPDPFENSPVVIAGLIGFSVIAIGGAFGKMAMEGFKMMNKRQDQQRPWDRY